MNVIKIRRRIFVEIIDIEIQIIVHRFKKKKKFTTTAIFASQHKPNVQRAVRKEFEDYSGEPTLTKAPIPIKIVFSF